MLHHLFSRLHVAHLLFAALILAGIVAPDATIAALTDTTRWFASTFGWLVMLCCGVIVIFCTVIAFGRHGHTTLGQPGEQPTYRLSAWLAMLFAAGMGSGLVFYGAAEPLIHYMQPPPSLEPVSHDGMRARNAMTITFFHWGIHAWAIYALAALSIAYVSYRHQRPMLPSAPITTRKRRAELINSLAIIAVVFGVAGALAQGVLQLSDAVMRLTNTHELPPMTLKLAILAGLAGSFLLSASSGIGYGIRRLSQFNMLLALGLLGFVLLAGPTQFLLHGLFSGIGDYLQQFVRLSFDMRPYADTQGWMSDWTVLLFLWWVAWAPFVGVFIARISKGRNLREFILGVMLAPVGFSFIWFALFGGTALHMELVTNPGFGALADQPQRTTFALLDALPYAQVTSAIAFLLLFVFLVTSADSGAYVLGMFSHHGAQRPPVKERLFWGGIITLITAASVLTGKGTEFFKSIAIFGAIPYLFILMAQMVGFWRALRRDASD